MKKLIIILFWIILISLSTLADAFELELKGSQMVFNDREAKAGPGIEMRLKAHDLHLSLSEERVWLYGNWIRLNSACIGFEYVITKRLHLWGQVGYYIPDYDESQFADEPLWFHQCKYLHGPYECIWWDRYTANWESDYGGEIGVDYRRRIYRRILLGLFLGYRCLNLNEEVTSYQKNGKVAWYVFQSRDFGGFKVGLIIVVEF